MAIVSSVVYQVLEQPSGLKHVYERHTDSQGIVYSNCYTAVSSVDHNARLAANAISIADMLAEQEAEALING